MASAGLNFTNITPDNGAIREVNKLIFKDVLAADRIGSLLNVFRNVYNGDKVGLVGEFGLLGLAGSGCSPTYGNDQIATTEKEWAIAAWEIAEKICYADLENTLVKYTLENGTNIADLTDNDYLEEVVVPRLELAMMKMYIRLAFFGDTNAAAVASGGVITNAADVPYFTLTNGIWQQLFTLATADPTKVVTITANSAVSKAAQIAGLPSEVIADLDALIAAAPPKLRQLSDQVIYITQTIATALEQALLANRTGSELNWTETFAGIREGYYRGIKLRVVPMFDEIIQSYEGDGTTYNLPHRAIYTTERNLALGVNGRDEFAELDIFFDRTTRLNHIYATDKLGALVLDDDLVVVAF